MTAQPQSLRGADLLAELRQEPSLAPDRYREVAAALLRGGV